jgi:hypothetical protein
LNQDERVVHIRPGTKEEAVRIGGEKPIGIAKEGIPSFTKVKDYTTFEAEYALKGRDLVFHFFLPKELTPVEGARLPPATVQYWTVAFAKALDSVARSHFEAQQPRLQAKYTEELHSWWLRAQGYDHLLDVPRFVASFFEKLDATLEHRSAPEM